MNCAVFDRTQSLRQRVRGHARRPYRQTERLNNPAHQMEWGTARASNLPPPTPFSNGPSRLRLQCSQTSIKWSPSVYGLVAAFETANRLLLYNSYKKKIVRN